MRTAAEYAARAEEALAFNRIRQAYVYATLAVAAAGVTEPEPLTWTITEAAQQMGVGPELIRRGVATGQIPSISLGNRTLIPRAALRNRVNGSAQEAS